MAAFNRFRLFHWLLAGFFLGAYLSGDDAETLHIWLGYGLLVLLVWRLLIVPLRLRGFPQLLPPKGQRKTPSRLAVGKWLTVAALGSFAMASLIGLGMVDNGDVLAVLPGVGPDVFGAASDINFVGWMGDAEEVHEFFANLGLWLIGLHVFYVLLFRRPLVWPMLRGVSRPGPAAEPAAPRLSGAPAAAQSLARLRVVARHEETADSCSLLLQVPQEQRSRFVAKPGQFLTVQVPGEEGPVRRCYSLSQLPDSEGVLRVTIKRARAGKVSNWLLDNLKAGDWLEALPPAGRFVPDSLDQDVLLLGAGSGITPLRAILQAVLQQGTGQVLLFYACRDGDSVIFADELARLAAAYPERFTLCIWLDAQQGIPDSQAMARQLAGWPVAEAFICGPEAFMGNARAALRLRGVAESAIHQESFALTSTRRDVPGTASRLKVTLAGRQHSVPVAGQQVVLQAMEQAGLEPPQACRAGVCGVCRCRVVTGQASMLSNQVLSEEEQRQGWILACQAVVGSPFVELQY